MSDEKWTGGCLCGALRYEADGPPDYMGHCYCNDCRKASGSGFIPFASYPAQRIRITGDVTLHRMAQLDGRVSVRNCCATCNGLVYGGIRGEDTSHTIYAGSLDNPALFKPAIAIFTSQRAPWALIPPGLKQFERMPQ